MDEATKPSIPFGHERPQDEADLLARFQRSPVGRVAASVHGLENEVDELVRLQSHAGAWAAICAESGAIEACHIRLTRLLLRISARLASERLAQQETLLLRSRR
jgi:hypothetical protein